MDLSQPADVDNVEELTYEQIRAWASTYLPPHSAEAFTNWIAPEVDDWANGDITIHTLLKGAWQSWTGHEMPDPA